MAQLVKAQEYEKQQRAEFKKVLDQLVQVREDSVSRSDFNKVLEELSREKEEARNDAREQLAQARNRELENNEREAVIRSEAREQRNEMANLYKQLLIKQQQAQPNSIPIFEPIPPPNETTQVNSIPLEVTKKLEEQQKEISALHQLLKVLQQNNAVTNPGQVVPVDNLPSLIAPQEATTTTIITPTTPIPTNNSSSVVHPEHSPAPPPTTEITVLHPPIINSQTYQIQQIKDEWQSAAELLYSKRSNSHLKNYVHVTEIIAANPFLFEPLLERCPQIGSIIAHLLKLRFGLTVQSVSWTTSISDWNGEDCRRVGCSVAAFLRNFQTGEAALEAWKLHYVQVRGRGKSERAFWKTRIREQYTKTKFNCIIRCRSAQLTPLLNEIEGFAPFMLVLFNNLLRDSKYGMVFRVAVGALLSTMDATTDIYTLHTYWTSGLKGQAMVLLAMILANLGVQILVILVQYKSKSWKRKLWEIVITLTFLRPAVDAYRVSTNHEDEEVTVDQLAELCFNKSTEMGTESIPGCVLQCYVYLISSSEQVGKFALLSIAVSCLTTGFTSAMISFDLDVDVTRRKTQPRFYGYIPGE